MMEIDYRGKNKLTLGLPRTPARWMGAPKYTEILKLTVTCGGGMGGSRWPEYVRRIPMNALPSNEMFIFTDIDGRTKIINTRYIVMVEQYTLVECTYYSENPYYPKGLCTVKYLVDDGQKVLLVPRFDNE